MERPPEGAGWVTEADLEISPLTYAWTRRVFDVLRRVLRVRFKLHRDAGAVAAGDVFVFNHFARFETFIPQYLILEASGAYCRSVASAEFFVEDDAFSSYLLSVGAVPSDYPRLLPFLAAEILRGRKVVLFPEGGMVKDRRVVDAAGRYSIYSRIAGERRKHHTGAAVLALGLEAFKLAVRHDHERGNQRRTEAVCERLGIEDVGGLLDRLRTPTTIVPANITFYPIRVKDNLLRRGAELLNRGISRRLSEELLIEGNILLEDTDMDIRLGQPIRVGDSWTWVERGLIRRVASSATAPDDVYDVRPDAGPWDARLLARALRHRSLRVRDDYMHRMYLAVSLNLSHLAATLIGRLLDQRRTEVADTEFRAALYLAVKAAQRTPRLHLHRSLRAPAEYWGLADRTCTGLDQFLATARDARLAEERDGLLRLLPKLREEHDFDTVRIENLVEVYANEAAPVRGVRRVVDQALAEVASLSPRRFSMLRFDDECIAHEWDRAQYSEPRHVAVNAQETATEPGAPWLLDARREGAPEPEPEIGIVAVHGFLASPAEMRGLGERLHARGWPVLGVRLAGHGTSPWDLRDRSFEDWLASVHRGLAIMRGLARRTCLVGFSTGGALALLAAAERPDSLAGVAAAGVPYRFRDRNMRFVPFVHGANRLVSSVSSLEGVMPFRTHVSEHPDINYLHMPIRALNELRRMVEALDRGLGEVDAPVVLLQASADPVVEPAGAALIRDRLRCPVELTVVESGRHGIVHEDVGPTHATIEAFIERLAKRVPARG